jgi:hypothetical protein
MTECADPTVADLAAQVAALRELVAAQGAELAALRAARPAEPASSAPAGAAEWVADFVPLKQAAARARVSERTMKTRAIKFGLGHAVGGRWWVDRHRLDALQEGRAYPPLGGMPG